MARSGLRVVPWVDWGEWARLREDLRSGDVGTVANALAQYRLRRASTLPQAIQSTASLRSLLLIRGVDDYSRRLGLSMAVVRLVNGVTDRIQPRAEGSTARSVHSLAKVVSLPPGLVEIRHQATHNALPRLDALETAALQALQWLESEYWAPQAESIARLAGGHRGTSCDRTDGDEKLRHDGSISNKIESNYVGPVAGSSRKRWRSSGNAEKWKSTPIGLLPGQVKVPQLVGVDVAGRIGLRWKPGVANKEDVDLTSLAQSAPDAGWQQTPCDSDGRRGSPGAEAETACANGSGEHPCVKKKPRVLSADEKDALHRMMKSMVEEDDNDSLAVRSKL